MRCPLAQDDGALFLLRQTGLDAVDGGGGLQLGLLAGGHVLAGHHAGVDLVLAQEDDVGDAQLVGVGDLLFELLLLAVELGADAVFPQGRGQGDGCLLYKYAAADE